TPATSERMRSEMIRPAGSSAPRLRRRPVLSRWRRTSSPPLLRARLARATRLGTFVLILDMAILRDCVGGVQAVRRPSGPRGAGCVCDDGVARAVRPAARALVRVRAGPG